MYVKQLHEFHSQTLSIFWCGLEKVLYLTFSAVGLFGGIKKYINLAPCTPSRHQYI